MFCYVWRFRVSVTFHDAFTVIIACGGLLRHNFKSMTGWTGPSSLADAPQRRFDSMTVACKPLDSGSAIYGPHAGSDPGHHSGAHGIFAHLQLCAPYPGALAAGLGATRPGFRCRVAPGNTRCAAGVFLA